MSDLPLSPSLSRKGNVLGPLVRSPAFVRRGTGGGRPTPSHQPPNKKFSNSEKKSPIVGCIFYRLLYGSEVGHSIPRPWEEYSTNNRRPRNGKSYAIVHRTPSGSCGLN